MPQARGHDLSHRGEGAHCGLLDASSDDGRRPQGDGESENLFVVEEKGRELASRVETIAPSGPIVA